METKHALISVQKHCQGRNIMKMFAARAVPVISLFFCGAALPAADAFAQSTREQLVGAWTLISADSVRPDGSRVEVFGSNPKGTMIFSSDGHFALIQMRGDLPRLASNSRDRGTPEENKAIVQGSIAYFGTYSVNDNEKLITLKLEGHSETSWVRANKGDLSSLSPRTNSSSRTPEPPPVRRWKWSGSE
jgi:hypothetical protein